MAKEKKTQYAILGMLSVEPMSGYEIKKTMSESTQHFWNESNGQLYPTLAKLTEEKLIRGKGEKAGDKKKTVYYLTQSGKKKLNEWLLKEVDYYPPRNELLLKIFFGDNVLPQDSIRHIQDHLFRCESQLEVYQGIESKLMRLVKQKKRPVYFLLTVQAGIKITLATMDWCRESIKFINKYT